MSDASKAPTNDIWSTWLLNDRHGGDVLHELNLRAEVDHYADRVIDGLGLKQGMTLLDVGTGDGLVAFRAIDRVGSSLHVVLTDLSHALIQHAKTRALAKNLARQCRFLQGSAEHLEGVQDVSIDAVGMRAVLAYVHNKRAALAEVHRVLKPGGRFSFAEPMLQDEALNAIALRRAVDSGGGSEHATVTRLLHRWKSAQFPDTPEKLAANPLVNYSERDLLALVQDSGFEDIELELRISVRRSDGIPWKTFLAASPHPLAPTLGRILDDRFDASERLAFERLLRPSVEGGVSNAVERVVYLTARKPEIRGL
jgi:arsenite methyltransferase